MPLLCTDLDCTLLRMRTSVCVVCVCARAHARYSILCTPVRVFMCSDVCLKVFTIDHKNLGILCGVMWFS